MSTGAETRLDGGTVYAALKACSSTVLHASTFLHVLHAVVPCSRRRAVAFRKSMLPP